MNKVFVKVTGELKLSDNHVIQNNDGQNVVVRLDIDNENEIKGIFVDDQDMKCVKTGAVLLSEEGRLGVDVFMHPSDIYVVEDAIRGYFIKAEELNGKAY